MCCNRTRDRFKLSAEFIFKICVYAVDEIGLFIL